MRTRSLAVLAAVGIIAIGCTDSDVRTGLFQQEEEFGPFGLPVGEPIDVISATRGDGVSFDEFAVTFNNAEGTDITITTPEGEKINFTMDDMEWLGNDPSLGGELIAKLTSKWGDRLEVMIGDASVPLPPVEEPQEVVAMQVNGVAMEDVPAYAVARLDEVDTRFGFETYGVVGMLTEPDDLPRYQEDILVDDELLHAAGDLAEGTAFYDGGFLASVFRYGELMSDSVTGDASVEIDFAGNGVMIEMEGGYVYDDVDDIAPQALIDLDVTTTTIDGIEYVTGVTPLYGNPGLTGQVVTDIDGIYVLGILVGLRITWGPVYNMGIVTGLDVDWDSTGDIDVVTGVAAVRADENDDFYTVSLTGVGSAADLDIGFNGGVLYRGDLNEGSFVEVPEVGMGTGVDSWTVLGDFAGAVFGPGAGADTVDPTLAHEVLNATATAGVFEANSGPQDEGLDPSVEIVGGFGARSSGWEGDDLVPPPEPPIQPQ